MPGEVASEMACAVVGLWEHRHLIVEVSDSQQQHLLSGERWCAAVCGHQPQLVQDAAVVVQQPRHAEEENAKAPSLPSRVSVMPSLSASKMDTQAT